jgi:hypothetical protein
MLHQPLNRGGPDAHDGIGTAPVELDLTVLFRHSTAAENDVGHIAAHFPGILWLQDPAIADGDHPGGVPQILQGDPQAVNGAGHGLKHPVVDIEPAMRGLDRGCPGADLHFVPVVGLGLNDASRIAPVNQVRRIGDPDRPRRTLRMRSIQAHVTPADLLREDDGVAHVRLADQGQALHALEVRGARQGDAHAVTRVGTVTEQVAVLARADAQVFDTEGLVLCEQALGSRREEGLGSDLKVETVRALGVADNRTAAVQVRAEQHDVAIFVLDDTGIVHSGDRVRHLALHAEARLDPSTALMAVKVPYIFQILNHPVDIGGQEACLPVGDDFRHASPEKGHHRGAAGHGFHHGKAERLIKTDGVQEGVCAAQQFVAFFRPGAAQIDDAVSIQIGPYLCVVTKRFWKMTCCSSLRFRISCCSRNR